MPYEPIKAPENTFLANLARSKPKNFPLVPIMLVLQVAIKILSYSDSTKFLKVTNNVQIMHAVLCQKYILLTYIHLPYMLTYL